MRQGVSNNAAVTIRRVSFNDLGLIKQLNREIFGEIRVINRYDRPDLIMLLASIGEEPVGFKVGYGETRQTYYSAKGGVVVPHRRQGIGGGMLQEMMGIAAASGYTTFAFESFPNRFPEMTSLAVKTGFEVVSSRYDPHFRDLKVRFERSLNLRKEHR